MRTYHNNPLTVSNTKSLNYICGNLTFESLNLHRETFTLEKIVPQGLIRNTPGLCMVCYGNVSSMRQFYGKSFDNTRQHIFLKTDARKSRSQWSLNCICTDSVTADNLSNAKPAVQQRYPGD